MGCGGLRYSPSTRVLSACAAHLALQWASAVDSDIRLQLVFCQRSRPIWLSNGILRWTPIFALNSCSVSARGPFRSPMGLCGGLRYSPSTRVLSALRAHLALQWDSAVDSDIRPQLVFCRRSRPIWLSNGTLRWTPIFALNSCSVDAQGPCGSPMG